MQIDSPYTVNNKADQAFQLDHNKSPVAAYLDINTIVKICLQNGVEAVHPGYGFLSEKMKFAAALEQVGISFIGPTVGNLQIFGDNKTMARECAIKAHVPVMPGSDNAFATVNSVRAFISDPANKCGYPVIVKAAMGGGGRGIRVVLTEEELEPMFTQASNEALNAFGDGRCFVEKYITVPRQMGAKLLMPLPVPLMYLHGAECANDCSTPPSLPKEWTYRIFCNAKYESQSNAGSSISWYTRVSSQAAWI
jgi:pyruvate carboxylase